MYSKAFRTLMVQKMTVPDRPDVESLSAEVGVPQSTLHRLPPQREGCPSPPLGGRGWGGLGGGGVYTSEKQ